jgi:hypothetical protein
MSLFVAGRPHSLLVKLVVYNQGPLVVFFNKPAIVNFSKVTTPFYIKFNPITMRISC